MRLWLAPSAFFPHRGGVEETTYQLALSFAAAGDEVLVVTHRHPRELAERESLAGVDVRRVEFGAPRARALAAGRYLRNVWEVQRTLDAIAPRPELIHVQCVSGQVPHLLLFARRHSIPLVVSTQGEVLMDADAIFQRSAYLRFVLRLASRRASALSACSAWTAQHTAAVAAGFAAATVIPNGVRPAEWLLDPVPREPILCAWGRHVPQKGFDLAIEAFARLRESVGDARLLIGGGGAETEHLRKIARSGVEFVGPLDRNGVRELLAASRVAVVPSRIEPFGIVALEALAAGRGLVYAAGTGLVEAAGGLGRAADPRDANALAVAMAAELAEPTPAVAGRDRAAQLSWERIAGAYHELYARAC
ncbi:MAG: glycosyltransferase family 4 protein [Solirubrobacteraceae bacterium]|jgi:glycosyltransferase involved in cell wall biosynthesis